MNTTKVLILMYYKKNLKSLIKIFIKNKNNYKIKNK